MVDLEREYSPSSRIGGTAEPFVAGYQARSAVVRAGLGDRLVDLGEGTLLVEAGPTAPLLVKAQSRAYAAHLEAAGVPVSSFECATRHHFNIVDDLVDPDTPLGRATFGGPT